jgi:hypothetical protein
VSKELEVQYRLLIERMEKLITRLDTFQGKHRMSMGADLYWYIQKLQEVELLVEGVAFRNREDLKKRLDELCTQICFRLEKDEEWLEHRRSA